MTGSLTLQAETDDQASQKKASICDLARQQTAFQPINCNSTDRQTNNNNQKYILKSNYTGWAKELRYWPMQVKKLPNIATDSAVACLTYGGISNSDYNIYRQSHSETSENQSAFGKVKVMIMSTVAPVLFFGNKTCRYRVHV